ncbi:hypothetical protein SAMN06265784_104170 [Paraburkholderia susongensis]|uniref:Uncharacterized protein n=2 Tax=Paraburkholderia susongensis TaxID=1515439 RepID=A0A1X7KQM6_9BURK|nr:hypothetical protein SAMN06265784_104170 [Paraburkholderia susongensis]
MNHKGLTLVALLYLMMVLLCVSGYITNVVWIIKHMAGAMSVEMIVALIGLFTPLGFLHGIYTWF